MQTVSTIAELRAALAPHRAEGVAMVPTMGALHDGHLSLVRAAGARTTVVSIFVNPTQFAPHEDFASYPRDVAGDLKKLATVEDGRRLIVFTPSAQEMYPEGFATTITVGGPSAGLETDFRPHFFAGVATVVAKLLLAAMPDEAVFGEKDYQQLLVIRRLATDLGLPTRIAGAPILREADGLAMSSRNAYLDPRQRAIAAGLNKVLRLAAERARNFPPPSALRSVSAASGISPASADARGGDGDLRDTEAMAAAEIKALGFDSVDYVAIRDAEDLSEVQDLKRPARILTAAKIGKTRLIDNMAV